MNIYKETNVFTFNKNKFYNIYKAKFNRCLIRFAMVGIFVFITQSDKANAEDQVSCLRFDVDTEKFLMQDTDLVFSKYSSKDEIKELGYYFRLSSFVNFHRAKRKTLNLPESTDKEMAMEAFQFAILNSPDSSRCIDVAEITLLRFKEFGLSSKDGFGGIEALLQIAKYNDDMAKIFEKIPM